jgi:hypothetical protein
VYFYFLSDLEFLPELFTSYLSRISDKQKILPGGCPTKPFAIYFGDNILEVNALVSLLASLWFFPEVA